METRVAVMSMIVGKDGDTAELNRILHKAGPYIIGRLGIPYRDKGVNIICVVIDAPQDLISSVAGQLGSLPDINVKTTYSVVQG